MKEVYHKKGEIGGSIIGIVLAVGIATVITIFTGVLSGQSYQLSESKIAAINDSTIKGYVQDSITAGFSAQKQASEMMPLIVLASVIGIVLAVVVGMTAFGGSRSGGVL